VLTVELNAGIYIMKCSSLCCVCCVCDVCRKRL